jgi:hypothetical protein
MPPRTSRGIKRLESRFFGDGERLPAETESAVRRSNPAQQTRPAAAGRGGGDKGKAWMGGWRVGEGFPFKSREERDGSIRVETQCTVR